MTCTVSGMDPDAPLYTYANPYADPTATPQSPSSTPMPADPLPTPPLGYYAAIGFCTGDSWIFRQPVTGNVNTDYNNEMEGGKDKTVYHLESATKTNQAENTKEIIYDYTRHALKMGPSTLNGTEYLPGTYDIAATDAILDYNDKEYSIKIEGLDKTNGQAQPLFANDTRFTDLYISTNIPRTETNAVFSDVQLYINGQLVHTMTKMYPKNDGQPVSQNWQLMLVNQWGQKKQNDLPEKFAYTMPKSSMEIRFKVSGVSSLKNISDEGSATPDPVVTAPPAGTSSPLPTPADSGDLTDDEPGRDLAVTGLDIAAGNTVKKGFLTVPQVELSWDQNRRCDGYEIWRAEGTKAFRLIDTIDDADEMEWYDTTVKKGTRYSYRVRGYVEDDNGDPVRGAEGRTVSVTIRKNIKSCTYTAKRTGKNLKITLKKAEGTKCVIQVRYRKSQAWKQASCKLNKKIVRKVSPKKLQVRIRTAEEIGGKLAYSKWTKVKTVR